MKLKSWWENAMMLLANFAEPSEGVQHKQDTTHAFIDGNEAGLGTLFIAESQVTWLSSSGQGFCLEYPKICLHAVSRDLSSFSQECLYLMVEGRLTEEEERQSESSDEDDDDEPTTEVRFVPQDKGALEAMFSAMSECQALHPDPEDVDSAGEFYEGEEGEEELTEEGRATLQHLDNLLLSGQGDGPRNGTTNGNVEAMENGGQADEGQFDDADMEQ